LCAIGVRDYSCRVIDRVRGGHHSLAGQEKPGMTGAEWALVVTVFVIVGLVIVHLLQKESKDEHTK
jgi:hypothetical protein